MAEEQHDVSKIVGNQLSHIVNAFRRRPSKPPVPSERNVDQPVRSVIGYQRWTDRTDDVKIGVEDESVQLNLSSVDSQRENVDDGDGNTIYADESASDTLSDGDEITTDVDIQSDRGSELSQRRVTSVYSLEDGEEEEEPSTTKVDTITEWQAGWNVTNAIQVNVNYNDLAISIEHESTSSYENP